MKRIVSSLVLIAATALLQGLTVPEIITVNYAFTPLHTYFMSPTGNDANNGTSTSTPWATPNHALVCGDVILAAPGTYSSNFWGWGTVSNCPSTTGGIDGAGGIYFATLLCAGSDLNACPISSPNLGNPVFAIDQNNWAVEGFKSTGSSDNSGGSRSYECNATASGTTIVHHIAFINDLSVNAAAGYDTNDQALNHNVPGNGCDYFAVIGSIAQNSAQDGICLAAIDVAGPANLDTIAGTHVMLYGNFSYNNLVSCGSDGEAFMFDTWDAHNFRGTGAIINNVAWESERYNLQIFYQAINVGSTATIMDVYNNTFYFSGGGVNNDFAIGGINEQSNAATLPYLITIRNNIGLERYAFQGNSSGSGGEIYAFLIGGNYGSTIGGTGNENIFKGQQTNCLGSSCDAGNSVVAFNGGSFGTNIYVDPSFTNTTDLINNRSGAPNCTGFVNVTACMGYNAQTQTLTTPSVISDITAGCAQCTGKGYQVPTKCQAVKDYPTWLKGIVYLHASGFVNGATITENSDLVTKPCGM